MLEKRLGPSCSIIISERDSSRNIDVDKDLWLQTILETSRLKINRCSFPCICVNARYVMLSFNLKPCTCITVAHVPVYM